MRVSDSRAEVHIDGVCTPGQPLKRSHLAVTHRTHVIDYVGTSSGSVPLSFFFFKFKLVETVLTFKQNLQLDEWLLFARGKYCSSHMCRDGPEKKFCVSFCFRNLGLNSSLNNYIAKKFNFRSTHFFLSNFFFISEKGKNVITERGKTGTKEISTAALRWVWIANRGFVWQRCSLSSSVSTEL